MDHEGELTRWIRLAEILFAKGRLLAHHAARATAQVSQAPNMTQESTGQKRKSVRAMKPSALPASWRQQRRAADLAKWQTWDWSKTDTELAEEIGLAISSIGWIRRRVGAPKSPRFHKWRVKLTEPNLAKWRSWDWSKQDVELAGETGRTRERIRQIRQLLDAPRSPHHGSHWARHRRNALALQWVAENLARLKGLSREEVRRKYGYTHYSPVYKFLKAKGVLRDDRLFRKYRWELMNFDLPNSVLQRIWKMPLNVAADHRYRKHLPPPKWSLVGGLAALRRRGQLGAYKWAVQAEKRKAAKHFARKSPL